MVPYSAKTVIQFRNCRLLRDHRLLAEDLWVRDGKIISPEQLFFVENVAADVVVDCANSIVAPGLIDVHFNGAFGCDFSSSNDVENDLQKVAKGVLAYGVTSFCPTFVTIRHQMYKEVLPKFVRRNGSRGGAGVLGVHLEGPFISKEKRGAHLLESIADFKNGISDVFNVYGDLDNVAMITLAPEIPGALDVIPELCRRGIVISLGHSAATLAEAEAAVANGARAITHLFNAMPPFHHRDPHLAGLLVSDKIPSDETLFYGLIADGVHTHATALRMAHRVYPRGVVLVTDATPAMGLPLGVYPLGCQMVEVKENRAVIAGTDLLCGSIVPLDQCMRNFLKATGCGVVEALESVTLHPAQLLSITHAKGTLCVGSDADFVLFDDQLTVKATYIAGEEVWTKDDSQLQRKEA